MTSGGLSPENTAQEAALDDDAAPTTGTEPDTASQSPSEPDSSSPPATAAAPVGDGRTVLDGPALENEEMRGATEELRSSEQKSAQARDIAQDLVAKTEPDRQD
jgi:hypothetical protein